jgi:hypothetical protein
MGQTPIMKVANVTASTVVFSNPSALFFAGSRRQKN